MDISLKGRFKDSLYTPNNEMIKDFLWQSNIIVYPCLDLVANLLKNHPGMKGVLYLAVGEGAEKWDENPPNEEPSTRQLVKEIFRKSIDPTRGMSYSEEAKTLIINIEFGPDEAVGTLREFGLFGGDATDTINSGFLINYKIHPKIEKTTPKILRRTIYLSFGEEAKEIRVPRLLGLSKENAKKVLLDTGLVVGKLSTKEVNEEEVDKVLEQNPIEGTLVTLKTVVDFVVGVRQKKDKVPDVANMTRYKAEKILEELGWRYKFTPISVSGPDIKIGRISKQVPEAGTFADKTITEIELFIVLYNLGVESIEGIGETFGKRFRALTPPINTLEELSLIDEKKIKIKGVSEERLLTWKYMSNLMTTIEGLDGNGAEILVQCKNIKTPEDLAAVSAQEFKRFYDECVEGAKKIKIPRDYIKNYFTQNNVKNWIESATKIINP